MKGDITFVSDKLRISGPLVDGGFRITLDVGEYMAEQVAKLVTLPQQVPLEVTVGLYQRSKGWDGVPSDAAAGELSEFPDVQESGLPTFQKSEKPEIQPAKNPNHETED